MQLPIRSSKRLLRRGFLFLVALLLSCLIDYWNQPVLPSTAAETVTISNTGTARFSSSANSSPRSVTSNTTTLTASVNQSTLQITKTGDRAAAEPGDTVIYRVLVRNTGSNPVTDLVLEDTLPFGLQFVSNSQRASISSGSPATPVSLAAPEVSDRIIRFRFPRLEPGQTLTVAYAVLVTPDAIRGSGRNSVVAAGRAFGQEIRSNQASYRLAIRPGILSDCGTILGRVFVDKNFDGEQQPGEAGVPNAVIFMDDGNRIVTDPDGLFSVANVISGYRTGALDLSSLPGYTLAPNLYRIEGNSQSRLVRLQPGGLARMNFAVTPVYGEGQQ